MVKKLTPALDDESLANAVRASAAQIWQAGLGAFAKAQEEGSRVLPRKPGKPAKHSGDKLEQVFEERVARALATIGVPDHDELGELRRRVDQLAQQVERLSAALQVRPSKPAHTAAAKPAAKSAKAVASPAAKPAAKAVAKKAAARKPAAKAR
jgi:hypothetical protein